MPITAKNFGSLQPKVNTWKNMLNDIANGDFEKVFDLTPRGIVDGTFLCTCWSDDNVFIRMSRTKTDEGFVDKVKAYTFEANEIGDTRTTPRPAITEQLNGELNGLLASAIDKLAVGIAEFAGKQELSSDSIKLDLETSKLHIANVGTYDVVIEPDMWAFTLVSPTDAGDAYLAGKEEQLRAETFKQLYPLIFQNQYAFIAETLNKHRGIAANSFKDAQDLDAAIATFTEMANTGDFTACIKTIGSEAAMQQLMKTTNALTEINDICYSYAINGAIAHKITLCAEGLDALVDLTLEPVAPARHSIEDLIATAQKESNCVATGNKKQILDR